jgi:hypothetical protein
MRENIIAIMKDIEPKYNNWSDTEINKQIDVIFECGYEWKDTYNAASFKHKESGVHLKIQNLNFYKPEKLRETYNNVWSKDFEGVKAKGNLSNSLKGLLVLILTLIFGFIFLKTEHALIINGIVLIYVLYNYIKFKNYRKRKHISEIEEEKKNGTYVDVEEIIWCKNCVNYREVKNWQSDGIYQVNLFESIADIPCQIQMQKMEFWKEFLNTPKEERFLYPKNCTDFEKK